LERSNDLQTIVENILMHYSTNHDVMRRNPEQKGTGNLYFLPVPSFFMILIYLNRQFL